MASGFDYRILQWTLQEIRVLCIDPDSNVSDLHPLRYKLKHISLQNVPVEHFCAVSYCWGTSKNRASIVLDGQDVTIPQITANALRNLSKVSSWPLWIDAICIDQNNLREKSQQVAMMGQVYAKAVSVMIWLGPSQISTADAMISMEKIYKQCLEVIGDLQNLNAHLYGTDGSPGFKYSNALLPDCDWPALQAFYSAPWFGRLWVIQEIGLAHDATVYVGSFSIGAEKVVLAARWMVHRKYARYCGGSETPGIESASSMYRPAGRTLANQLRRTHRAGCREARDKVYGLLGLLHEETASAIVADYTKPLVDVYAHAIRLALHEARDLSFLQFSAWYMSPKIRNDRARRLVQWVSCGFLMSQYSLDTQWPSWVLKLHGETSDESGACRNVLTFNRSTMGTSFGLQTKILDESHILSLRGLTIDTISLVGPIFTVNLLKNTAKLTKALRWCVQHGCKHRPTEESACIRDLAICLTCGSNKVNADAELHQEHIQAFALFLQGCRQLSPANLHKISGTLRRLLTCNSRQDFPVYWDDLWSTAINRRFFVTATGMMGMGPPSTKAEDLTCIMFGSEVPFVLRPLDLYFNLIGDAYVRAGGVPCNGKTLSNATGYGIPAENTRGSDLIHSFAQTRMAERWFDII
ncbi:MAG: hypothetical protein Q9182_002848 [Xanthomendoza sp. 2 TL-2023]